MPPERRVDFEKYLDPFLPVDDQEDEFGDDNEWMFARRKFMGEDLRPTAYKGYFLSSTYSGVYALGEHNLWSKRHKVWRAHTTFTLTDDDKRAIESVDGVEGAKVVTPYQFLFAVGQMFQQEKVKESLRAALCPSPKPAVERRAAAKDPLVRAGMARFPCWTVVRLASGRKDLVGGATREEVEERLAARADVAEVLQTSWKGGTVV